MTSQGRMTGLPYCTRMEALELREQEGASGTSPRGRGSNLEAERDRIRRAVILRIRAIND